LNAGAPFFQYAGVPGGKVPFLFCLFLGSPPTKLNLSLNAHLHLGSSKHIMSATPVESVKGTGDDQQIESSYAAGASEKTLLVEYTRAEERKLVWKLGKTA
jgi:hypothetical protein